MECRKKTFISVGPARESINTDTYYVCMMESIIFWLIHGLSLFSFNKSDQFISDGISQLVWTNIFKPSGTMKLTHWMRQIFSNYQLVSNSLTLKMQNNKTPYICPQARMKYSHVVFLNVTICNPPSCSNITIWHEIYHWF